MQGGVREDGFQAVRDEKAGKWSDAKTSWELLQTQTKDDSALRRWHLLAARKVRELKDKQ